MTTKSYSRYIDPYIRKIKNNEVEHCLEQELMIDNIVIPALERDDVVIDDEKIEKGLSLQKYFPYKLIEWEVFLFALIVGALFTDGDIVFNDIRVIVGRGSGKNGFISFLCFYFLSPYHGIRGYNIDLMANAEDQAKTSFKDVYEVITDPVKDEYRTVLKKNYHATKELITGRKTKSELRFNTSSKRGKDSKRTGCIIFDEKHEYTDVQNMNTLKSGLGKVWHGRTITITTDGHIRGAVLDQEKEQNQAILKEYNSMNRTLVFWCRIEDEKEWDQIDKLIKAIPSLNDFPSLKTTIQKEIIDMPYSMDYFPEFMAKRCNYPIGNKEVEVATWDDIKATNQAMIDLRGKNCVGGVDYSSTNDFTACVLLFRVNGKYYIIHHTFVCSRSRDLPGIKAPLKEWEKKGDLEYVDDVEIPAEAVVDWFVKMSEKYNILKIAIDKYRYSYLNKAFKAWGFDAYEKKNIYIARPSDEMRVSPIINSLFINHALVFGDVPIMRWYTQNTKKEIDGINVKYGKIEPNYRKTDGFKAFAAAMSIEEEIPEEVNYGNVNFDVYSY
ncbi:terminase large subunit [Blautia producta]|uniref:terminase TerL endonuclease subunit n=1 Tax=Blautia producta TaxID=33035 RepID=UPI00210ADB5D|nr:terminase TerL endonuclease subunit [Blautia producta]MCQ5127590.1 terminase large subunit [Blautia producta]